MNVHTQSYRLWFCKQLIGLIQCNKYFFIILMNLDCKKSFNANNMIIEHMILV
jgi:hypothetical protein